MSKACVYSSKFMAAAADRSSFIQLIFIFYDVCRGDVHTPVCTYVATKGIQTSTNVVRYPFFASQILFVCLWAANIVIPAGWQECFNENRIQTSVPTGIAQPGSRQQELATTSKTTTTIKIKMLVLMMMKNSFVVVAVVSWRKVEFLS